MKLRYCIYILIALISLQSCHVRPMDIMDKEKMANVVYEIHLAEASISVHDKGYGRLEKQSYFDSIFKKYGITKEDFDKSVDWYAKHPKQYDEVYTLVREKLDKEEELVKSHYYHPQTAIDSTRNVEMWMWSTDYQFNDSVLKDTLSYRLVNKGWLDANDAYSLKFQTAAWSKDSLNAFIKFIVYYGQEDNDTLIYPLHTDGVKYRYEVKYKSDHPVIPDSFAINLWQSDSLYVDSLRIDSVQFLRLYNYIKYPLKIEAVQAIQSYRDSVNPIMKDEEKNNREIRDRRISKMNLMHRED